MSKSLILLGQNHIPNKYSVEFLEKASIFVKFRYSEKAKKIWPIFHPFLMPCPFTGPKMFCAGPNFLCRTKNLFTYCASHKHFVPDQKMICIQ